LIQGGAGAGHDDSANRFDQAPVGHADAGDIGDRRMLAQHLFDLGGVDVNAAALDDVALASDKKEIAVFVDAAEIADSDILAALRLGGQFRVFVVAVELHVGASAYLADLARRDLTAVVVEKLQFNAEKSAPDAIARGVAQHIVALDVGVGAGLGSRRPDAQDRTQPVDDTGAQVGVDGAAAGLDQADRAAVEPGESRRVEKVAQQGREQEPGRDSFALDQVEGLFDIEVFHQIGGGAQIERQHGVAEPRRQTDGKDAKSPIPGREPLLDGALFEPPIRSQGPFRFPRRARGMQHGGGFRADDGEVRIAAIGDQIVKGVDLADGFDSVAHDDDLRREGAQKIDLVGEPGAEDDGAAVRLANHMGDIVVKQPVIDQGRDGADTHDREIGDDGVRMIEGQYRDLVARLVSQSL